MAKQQGARSWGLRAALSLAKLYQSTARPVDAHAVLAPALEGFSPTPEMPEIAEAEEVLAPGSRGEMEEVMAAIAQRQRLVGLQTSYAPGSLLFERGPAADETKAAFERAGDLATRAEFPAERFFRAFWSGVLEFATRGSPARRGISPSAFFERRKRMDEVARSATPIARLAWRFYFSATCSQEGEEASSNFGAERFRHGQRQRGQRREVPMGHQGGLLGLPSTSVMVCRRPSPRASINQGGNWPWPRAGPPSEHRTTRSRSKFILRGTEMTLESVVCAAARRIC